jgi:hypothetical protein
VQRFAALVDQRLAALVVKRLAALVDQRLAALVVQRFAALVSVHVRRPLVFNCSLGRSRPQQLAFFLHVEQAGPALQAC